MTSSDSSVPHFSGFRRTTLFHRLRGRLSRDRQRSQLFRSALSTHPILYTPSPIPGFKWLVHPPGSLAFVPILRTQRDHFRPCSPSIPAWLTLTRLVKVHLRYGLCSCARPRSGSGATFIRRCSCVSVALHTYAIATQSTNLLLRQDFHLQETERFNSSLKMGYPRR